MLTVSRSVPTPPAPSATLSARRPGPRDLVVAEQILRRDARLPLLDRIVLAQGVPLELVVAEDAPQIGWLRNGTPNRSYTSRSCQSALRHSGVADSTASPSATRTLTLTR